MGYEYEVYGWAGGKYVLVGECETLDHALKTMQQAADDLGGVRQIHLLHLSSENSDETLFKNRVQAATGIPVYVAKKESVCTK